jgi:hypothetical protein
MYRGDFNENCLFCSRANRSNSFKTERPLLWWGGGGGGGGQGSPDRRRGEAKSAANRSLGKFNMSFLLFKNRKQSEKSLQGYEH